MTPLPELSELRRKRRTIQDQLAALGDLRPGSLTPRYRKCGKPSCHCAARRPRTRTELVVDLGRPGRPGSPAEAVEQTRAQIAGAPGPSPASCSRSALRRATLSVKAAQKKMSSRRFHREIIAAASLIGDGVLDDFQAIETEAMGQAVARTQCRPSTTRDLDCPARGALGRAPSQTFTTALGPLTLECLVSRALHHGFSPRDRALGMEHTFLRAALRMTSPRQRFAPAPCCANWPASPSPPRRSNATPRPSGARSPGTNAASSSPSPAPSISASTAGVPARKTEVEGREGKQPDASAKTRECQARGRMVGANHRQTCPPRA